MESVKLRVANIRLDLWFECARPLFSLIYDEFIVPSHDVSPPQIQLTYQCEELEVLSDPNYPVIKSSGTNVTELPEGLLFNRHEGNMLAIRDFSTCRVSSSLIKNGFLPEPFEGSPWVLLVLWGWFSMHNGVLLHGSLVSIENQLVLFLGASGTGKTTLSKLAVEAGYSCLTEENPLLTIKNGSPWGHATPWPGILGPITALSGPIKAIFFLRHSIKNQLTQYTSQEAGRKLLDNLRFFHWIPKTIPSAIDIIDSITQSTPVYDFGFIPDTSSVKLIQEML